MAKVTQDTNAELQEGIGVKDEDAGTDVQTCKHILGKTQ
jgi:hypothetical protein